MNEKHAVDSGLLQATALRREAEQRLRDKEATPAQSMTEVDVRALLHELQVHQIELEMQNAELLYAQKALQESSNKYHDLFDFAPVGYFRLDKEGQILEVNLAGAALMGLDRSTAIHKRFAQSVAIQSRARFADFLTDMLRADDTQTCEIELQHDQTRRYALLEGILSDDVGGNPSFRFAAIDITSRKRIDDVLDVPAAVRTPRLRRRFLPIPGAIPCPESGNGLCLHRSACGRRIDSPNGSHLPRRQVRR